jgi:hypothetical protein
MKKQLVIDAAEQLLIAAALDALETAVARRRKTSEIDLTRLAIERILRFDRSELTSKGLGWALEELDPHLDSLTKLSVEIDEHHTNMPPVAEISVSTLRLQLTTLIAMKLSGEVERYGFGKITWGEDLSPGMVLLTLGPPRSLDSTADSSKNSEPPMVAEFLLEVFLSSKRGQAALGDMRERFDRECVELGRKRAVRRYWAHTVQTLLPLARRSITRAIKWGAFVDAFWHHWHG